MNQPDLGKKINEIRIQKGITQKELSESCNVDIRTIQRIESGEVFPRTSTTRLIAEALEITAEELNGNIQNGSVNRANLRILFFITTIVGIIHLIDWLFYAPLIPKFKFYNSNDWIFSIINVITTVFFYYGFYMLGKYYGNNLLKFASSVFMIGGPLYFITTIIANAMNIDAGSYLNQLILSLLGINCVLFGAALIKTKTDLPVLSKSTGILQVLIAPFFILPIGILNIIGCWMNIPLYILMICIMYLEYRKLK